jgi:hypothetical protein
VTKVVVDVGDVQGHSAVLVYDSVSSFVGHPKKLGLMAMRVSLGRGDTIVTEVPKAAFWVTYFSNDHGVAPPTIELKGDGLCTLGKVSSRGASRNRPRRDGGRSGQGRSSRCGWFGRKRLNKSAESLRALTP